MTLAVSNRRDQILLGAGLGLYAAMVAIAPGIGLKAVLCVPLILIPAAWWILATPYRWLAAFFFLALLTPPLPVALGNSGPHVALLLALAGLWIGVLRMGEWRMRIDRVSGSLLALFYAMLASICMAVIYSGLEIAAGSFARVLLFGISVYIFLYTRNGPVLETKDTFRPLRALFWAGAASALFACVDFYYQFPAPAGYGPQFIWLDSGVFRRAQGFFYEASTLGNLCAFFLEMIAVALFRPRAIRPLGLPSLLAGGTALAAALVLSYSRASLVNLAVAIVILFWLNRHRIRLGRLLAGAAIFSAAAVGILSLAFPVFAKVYLLRIASSIQYFYQTPNAVLSGRLQNWALLRDFLFSHPWHVWLGVGYKTLPYSDFIGTTAVADNTYLSLLAETGIAGLLAVVALNAAILVATYRASKSADSTRSFCGTWMFCFWAGQAVQMLSADLLTYWRVLPVYFFVLALALRGRTNERPFSRSVQ